MPNVYSNQVPKYQRRARQRQTPAYNAKPREAANQREHAAKIANLRYAKPRPSKVRGPLPQGGQRNTSMARLFLYAMVFNYFLGESAALNAPPVPFIPGTRRGPAAIPTPPSDAPTTTHGNGADAPTVESSGPLSLALGLWAANATDTRRQPDLAPASMSASQNELESIRAQRSVDGHHHHHDHHHHHTRRRGDDHRDPQEPHHRRRGNAHQHHHPSMYDAAGYPIRDEMRNATVYPSEKVSDVMHDLINAVGSFESILAKPLKKIGYDPNESLPFDIVYLGQERTDGQTKMLTASEVVQHFTTTERQGYHLMGQSPRANELVRLITDKKYKKGGGNDNFLTIKVLNPIKREHSELIRNAIKKRLESFGIDRDDRATLREVHYRGRGNPNLGAAQHGIKSDLGSVLEIEKDGETRRYAIVPHHPELVIQIPASGDAWKKWMKDIGKSLFYRDPSAIPSHAHFYTEINTGSDYSPIRVVGSVVKHTVQSIVDNTIEAVARLVTTETTFEEALHTMLGLYIPYYDVGKAMLQKDFKSAALLLGFEIAPQLGTGLKQIAKVTFRGTRIQQAVSKVVNSDVIPHAFDRIKDVHGMGLVGKVAKPAGRLGVDMRDDIATGDQRTT